MTQTTDPISSRPDAGEVRQQLAGKHVCPFCGVIRADQNQPCPRCTMEDTSASRSATRQRIGPWFVLQARNPSAPGMKFATLLSLVKKGHVTPRSIVRGPTTHQLWTFAAKVRGLSREFGICCHCGESTDSTLPNCRHCDRPQEPPTDPDSLLEVGASTAPELPITASATPETGMDGGGASLDLQLDDGFGIVSKPARPSKPSIAAAPAVAAGRPMLPVPAKQQEEAILTAKELAAAFQLDFKPTPGNTTSRGTALIDSPAAKPRKIENTAKKKSGGGALKTVLVLLLIGAIAVAIVMVLRPDVRDQSVAWLNTTWASIKSSLEAPANKSTEPAKQPANTPATPAKPAPAVPPPAPKPAVNEPKVVERPASPVPVEPKVETPKPPEVAKVEPPPVTPAPAPVKPPAPIPAPAPPAVVVPEIDPNLTIEQAEVLARQLRERAIDAEGRDWRAAVRLYEQIQKLPADVWPRDLQLRLDRAQKNVQ